MEVFVSFSCFVGLLDEAKPHESHYFEVFELLHNWGGLLVEANPLQFVHSLSSGRRAWQVGIMMQSSSDIVLMIVVSPLGVDNRIVAMKGRG